MKFYIVIYNTEEQGELEAFTSKRAAQARHAELSKTEGVMEGREFGDDSANVETVYDIQEVDFPPTKEGLRQAIEHGAYTVPK